MWTDGTRRAGIRALVGSAPRFEQLGAGFGFTEGPVWHPDGFLLFSDMPRNTLRRWDAERGPGVALHPSNRCNGLVLDAAGRLLICEYATSRVSRAALGPAGEVQPPEVLASHFDGKELNSPNDIVVDERGAVLFSDSTYGRLGLYDVDRRAQLDYCGVYRLDPETRALELLSDALDQPNGLCFSPDGSRLYVNDSARYRIELFAVAPDGRVSGPETFAEGLFGGTIDDGIPDGMKCDEHGNVWVTGPGGLLAFDPDGNWLGTLALPQRSSNFAFGGDDLRTIYCCCKDKLFRVPVGVAGAPLPGGRRAR